MNDMVFHTEGDWPTTTLYNNGEEVQAIQLFVEIRAGRDDFGNPIQGGIYGGSDLSATLRTQEEPTVDYDILPGRITIEFPGHAIAIENAHPLVDPSSTRVSYNGVDVTGRVVDVYVEVNADANVVKALITLYKAHWIASDEAITYAIAG